MLIAAIAVTAIGGILLLASLSNYLHYLDILSSYSCEEQARHVTNQQEEQSLSYCQRVLFYNIEALPSPVPPLIFGSGLSLAGASLFLLNYRPSLFRLKRFSE